MNPMIQNTRANAANSSSRDVASAVRSVTLGVATCCFKRNLHRAVWTIGKRQPGSLREGNS